MKTIKKISLGISFLILCVSTVYAQNPLDWQIKANGSGAVIEGNKYGLWCLSENDFLKAERRDYGVNLIWKSNNPINVRFERQNGDGEIKTGERVAIFFDGEKGGYLYYKKREHGINLEFSPTPKYEWEIRNAENKDDRPIAANSKVAIYSSVEEDFMRGCKRGKPVVNLAWSKDCVCISGDCYRKPVNPTWAHKIEKLAMKQIPFLSLLE